MGGKTTNAQLHQTLLDRLHEYKLSIMQWVLETWDGPGEMIFYGEGYGPQIQSGGWYRDDIDAIFFDIRANGWWLNRDNVESICQSVGLPLVPVRRHRHLGARHDNMVYTYTYSVYTG